MTSFELLQIAIGTKTCIDKPSAEEWIKDFSFAEKQSLTGVLFSGIERLPKDQLPKMDLLMDWLGQTEYIKSQNEVVNQRAKELTKIFLDGGFRTCVLKGQGNALYYPNPSLRQSGDIDLWVDAPIDNIVEFVRSLGVNIHDIHMVHATAEFFDDVVVEIHFQPSWMYNPFTEKRLEKFFEDEGKIQFQLMDKEVGFVHPSLSFNLVYNLVHINRHIFDDGIGLRQIVDYFYILKASDAFVRKQAFTKLKELKLAKFTTSLMYVMQEVLGMDDSMLLCEPNEKLGRRLLKDIMAGGNFGKHGKYARKTSIDQRWLQGWYNMKRNWQFITAYPEEVLWIPFFKVWHWWWRKRRGYL